MLTQYLIGCMNFLTEVNAQGGGVSRRTQRPCVQDQGEPLVMWSFSCGQQPGEGWAPPSSFAQDTPHEMLTLPQTIPDQSSPGTRTCLLSCTRAEVLSVLLMNHHHQNSEPETMLALVRGTFREPGINTRNEQIPLDQPRTLRNTMEEPWENINAGWS